MQRNIAVRDESLPPTGEQDHWNRRREGLYGVGDFAAVDARLDVKLGVWALCFLQALPNSSALADPRRERHGPIRGTCGAAGPAGRKYRSVHR